MKIDTKEYLRPSKQGKVNFCQWSDRDSCNLEINEYE